MRAVGICVAVALTFGGCSLLFNGSDLKGKNGGNNDMTGGGDDMAGGGGGGAGGGGTGGGGGTTGACTPTTTVKFTKSTPSVAATGPYEIALADIDHDGKLDIVTANYNSNSFSVLLGAGDGTFALAPSTPVTTCNTPQLVLARDFTGDTLADIVISCFDSSTPTANVNVYVNESTPGMVRFAPVQAVTLPNQAALYYMAAGNFNSDTKLDLMLDDPTSDTARLFVGNGNGTFTAGATFLSANKGASWMTAGNLNGDAIDDVLIYNGADNDMTLLLSNGATFTPSTLAKNGTSGTLYYVNSPPSLIDINHDGLVDILSASATTSTGTVEKFLNSGSATAPAFPVTPVDIVTGDLPIAQGFADFNCDGVLDIAVSTNGCNPLNTTCPGGTAQPPNLWILPGHGTGYDAAITTGIPLGADSLAIGDFNGDGYPDIVAGAAGTTVTVLVTAP